MFSRVFSRPTTFQHFIVKRIQNLRTCTRSDMCQSLLGIHPISSYIDTRKLLFLQKLCSLHDSFLTKRIKCWNVVGLLILDCFTFHSRIKQVGKTTDLYNLTSTHGFVEFDMIPLMAKKAFRPFLQALVIRSVALKREFISIPR